MSSISSVGGYSAYSAYSTISSGGNINKAAEDASGLAIQEKTKSQVNGLEAGKENLTSVKSALNVEDGALGGIQDYLQKIKELSIKSINGTLSDDDKKSIQNQIDQYKQGINDIASNTTYNEKNLLNKDGALEVASDGNGSSETVSTHNSMTAALGIEDYNVTGDFDMSKIDSALEKVSGQRSTTGSQTNAVDYAMTYNSHAALELDGYQMDKEENRSVDAFQQLKTKQALDVYQANLQKQQMEDKEQKAYSLFA
ncbi:MAG: flagellin [Butyrivibrio sp.]|nr:flagellin [Butyrivibrio sp.]